MKNQFDHYKEEIIKSNPLKQRQLYKYERWVKWLSEVDNHSLLKELNEVHITFKGLISRKDLILFSKNFGVKPSKEHSIKCFLACMMWGYGGNTEKDIDHRGPFRVKQMFKSSDNVSTIIHQAFCSINEGNIEKAFSELTSIKGLSISFLSKFLYFISRAFNIKEYALIFDVRVAQSLIKLTSTREDFIDIVTISPSVKYSDFQKYLDFAHNLANEYSCEAENIEFFLFEKAGDREILTNSINQCFS
jgi:hypothetical protein